MMTCYNVYAKNPKWIIDSRALDHMCGKVNRMVNVVNVDKELKSTSDIIKHQIFLHLGMLLFKLGCV